jgi:hypothetical protein
MIDTDFAKKFARDWIAAWNNHDLQRVLQHYSDNFEMSSPNIIRIANEPSGRLIGKVAIGQYWTKALELIPDLQFELISILVGIESITLYYQGVHGRPAAEVFHFGPDRKVIKAYAHYEIS